MPTQWWRFAGRLGCLAAANLYVVGAIFAHYVLGYDPGWESTNFWISVLTISIETILAVVQVVQGLAQARQEEAQRKLDERMLTLAEATHALLQAHQDIDAHVIRLAEAIHDGRAMASPIGPALASDSGLGTAESEA